MGNFVRKKIREKRKAIDAVVKPMGSWRSNAF
jgi:hypothetical protein